MARTPRRDQTNDDPVVGYNEIKSALEDAHADRFYRYTGAGVPRGPITVPREAAGETRKDMPAPSALPEGTFSDDEIKAMDMPTRALMMRTGLISAERMGKVFNQLTPAPTAPAPTPGSGRVTRDEVTITADAPSTGNNEQVGAPVRRSAATAQGPRVLRRGDRSEETRNIQQYLKDLGYNIGDAGADGVFGSDTEAAVKQFQKDRGLAVDGAVGKNTYAALTKATAPAAPAGQSSGFKEYLGEGVTPTTEDPRPDSIVRPIKTSPVRFDMSEFSDKNIDEAVGEPIDPSKLKGARGAPNMTAEEYLDLGLDKKPRLTAFPLFRGRRNRY